MQKIILTILIALIGACKPTAEPPPVLPTATVLRVVQATTVPTFDRRIQMVDAPTPTPPACERTGRTRVSHEVTARVDYSSRQVNITQRIYVPNVGDVPLDAVALDVEPNSFPGSFILADVRVAGAPAGTYEILDRRMTIGLNGRVLEPGCETTIDLRFDIVLPPVAEGWAGRDGYFGYTDRQLNLGRWLPAVAHRQNGDWVVHETTPIGEQSVADVADWEVTVQVVNAPAGTRIAAPGIASRPSADSERFVLSPARDFALSISHQFESDSTVTQNGVTVEVFTLGDTQVQTDRGLADGAGHALDTASRSLEMFGELFGSYHFDKLVVVQGDFADGMEFSGLIFVGNSWFANWNGTPQSYLTLISVHEVAHQWWYASVGSDQALSPWLDEALATYSEFIYYQEAYPDLDDWWWQFRVYSFVPDGFADIAPVGSRVYHFQDVRAYINAVYLRGAQMIHQLRRDMGDEAFFAWLAAYSETGRDRVTTPDILWSLLTPQQLILTRATRQTYLGG
jgi:hypothetical protein